MFNIYKVTSEECHSADEFLFVCEYKQERERICEALSMLGLCNDVPPMRLDYLDCSVIVNRDIHGGRYFTILTVQETMEILRNKHLRKTEVNMKKRYYM